MAIVPTWVRSTPLKLTYLLTGDGVAKTVTLDNAMLQGDATGGPLANALNAQYLVSGVPNLPTMQNVFGGGSVRMWLRPQNDAFAAGVDVAFDVAVGATAKPVVVVATTGSAPAGTAYLDIEFVHSIVE